jgi:adenylate cyclase
VESRQKADEILLLKQQKRIAEMNVAAAEQEKERQTRLRKTLFLVAAVILISALIIFYFYITKRREHQKLAIAYRDLDKTKNKLESAEQQIRKLLDQQVSGAVARELLANNTNKPGERRYVCIMFLDVRDFTPMAEKMSPEELITFQNNAFGFMIDIIQKHHGHMNQLLGDGFMATFGAPVSEGNDCQNAYNAAREIIREVNERSKAGVIPKTRIGIGLHAGFVVTGNVGTGALSRLKLPVARGAFWGYSSLENPLRSAAMRGNLRLD